MRDRNISTAQVIAPILLGVSLILMALLFLSVNDGWVRVHLPALPWSPRHTAFAFEARLWAVMLTFAMMGSILAVYFMRRQARHLRGDKEDLQMRVATLERELDRVNKLLVISRDKG